MAMTAAEKRAILHENLDALLADIDVKELYRYAVARVGIKVPSVAGALAQLRHCHSVLTSRYEDVISEALAQVTPEAVADFRARNPRAQNAMICQFENGARVHVVILQRLDTPTPTVWWVENDKIKQSYKPLHDEAVYEAVSVGIGDDVAAPVARAVADAGAVMAIA